MGWEESPPGPAGAVRAIRRVPSLPGLLGYVFLLTRVLKKNQKTPKGHPPTHLPGGGAKLESDLFACGAC
jgi:hypothetical protein